MLGEETLSISYSNQLAQVPLRCMEAVISEVHGLLEGVKIVQCELMEVLGFHPVTPAPNPTGESTLIHRTVHGRTLRVNHPKETLGGFRHAFPTCAVVQVGGVGPASALLCPASVQRLDQIIALVCSIKHGHLQVT